MALRRYTLPNLCGTLHTYCRQRVFSKQHGHLSLCRSRKRDIHIYPGVKLSSVSDHLNSSHGRDLQHSLLQKTYTQVVRSSRWFSSPSTEPVEMECDSSELLKMRYVFVTCCEDMWEDAPGGLKFDVGYLDSHPGAPYNLSVPVVVGVHGAPGSSIDLQPILEPLIAKGCRVILPNLPGFGFTRGLDSSHDDCFTHSPEEYSNLIAGILTVLGIPKVDLMVGHSAGCRAVLDLCSEYKGVKSALMISPTVHKPYRGIQPLWLLKYLTKCWDVPMLRPIVKSIVYLEGLPRGYSKVPPLHLVNSMRAAVNVDYNNMIHNMVNMKEAGFPSCVVFSDNDRKIALSQFEEFIELMGVSKDSVETYTIDSPSHDSGVSKYPKGLLLKGGSHYPVLKFHQVLVAELQKLLLSVR